MPLSTNGAARTLGDDREARRAAQTQAFEQSQSATATQGTAGHGSAQTTVFFMPRVVAGVPRLQVQPRPRVRGLLEGFVKTCQRWRLEKGQQGTLLGWSDMASAEGLLSGHYLNLSQDVKDRVGYVVGISVGLGTLFNESVDAEVAWLNRPHPKLHNRSPLAHILQGRMAQLIAVSALVDEERALR
jgi:hypothetical protein